MAWANLYPGVYCGLREYELAWAKIFPRGINWPRPHYTRVYSGRGYILACYTGISSQQINYFVSVLTLIKSFARRTCTFTHIRTCTPIYIYRDIHTCMNSYIKQALHYPIDHRQWENDIDSFIHS